jgi:hypothetical protein
MTNRLLMVGGTLYASAAGPNPNGNRFWDHGGLFFRREASGKWVQIGTLPYNAKIICAAPDGTIWAVAPESYEVLHIYRTRKPLDFTSFEEVHRGTNSYLGASVSPEGNFICLYAESGDMQYGHAQNTTVAFYEKATDKWYMSKIATPEGRYGYDGIILHGRKAVAVLNSALSDPEHVTNKPPYTWRHVRLARCEDLTQGEWKNVPWLMPEYGDTVLQDLIEAPDGAIYLAYANRTAATAAEYKTAPYHNLLIARIRSDLSAHVYTVDTQSGSNRLLIDSAGGWHVVGRKGTGNLHLWDLDPRNGFRASNEREIAHSEGLQGYVIHTLRPARFGGQADGDIIHLLDTENAKGDYQKEDVAYWHVAFRLR